ncbi:MAG: hypothetical protein KKH04_15865 [Proteobacteria bacterium]|nr:hypothetical protein [Pseudomonadota bacterium]
MPTRPMMCPVRFSRLLVIDGTTKQDFEVRQPEWFHRERFKVREEAEFL